jgi:aminocarboxymuconate-semialdehyde decarboxylase
LRRICDFHSHVYPPEEQANPMFGGDCPLTIEKLLDAHAAAGIEFAVVTCPLHYLRGVPDRECIEKLKRWHEYAAELAQKYRDRIVVFAGAVPTLGEASHREFERAVEEYGFRGCFINSSHNDHYPDEDVARDFWRIAAGRHVAVMIHAPECAFGEERMGMYRLVSSVGRPMDETLSVARLIVRGVFEELPDLRLIAAHVGGGICEVLPRMDYAYELRDYANFLGSYKPVLISKKPSEYLCQMYFDTASYSPPVVKMGIEVIGIDRMLFGSDGPPLTPLIPRAREIIEQLPISEADRDKIFIGNVEKLLGLRFGLEHAL